MKIIDAINMADELRPNNYSQAQKIRWLATVDGSIKKDIIDTHQGGKDIPFEPYTPQTDINNTTLLAPFPYDELYVSYLIAQIDYFNGETADYNNSITSYNTQMSEYASWYNRTHMPLKTSIKYW